MSGTRELARKGLLEERSAEYDEQEESAGKRFDDSTKNRRLEWVVTGSLSSGNNAGRKFYEGKVGVLH